MATYRRMVVTERGGPEVMQVIEEALPHPGPGEVRVHIEAAGVSAYDLMLRSVSFPGFPKVPFTPGVDLVGVVDAAGDGVTTVAPGDRISALMEGGGGTYAENVCLSAETAIPTPAGLDAAETVCVLANYLTAHTMLHRVAAVEQGDRILVQGAAGGVGSALLDLGRRAGLEMYGTASAHNHEFVASFGATSIDYRTEDFVARIRELTGDGVDAVFDPIGGGRQLWRSYRTLRKGGRLIWFGVAAISRKGRWVIPSSLLTKFGLSLIPDGKKAPLTPTITAAVPWYRESLTTLLGWLEDDTLQPRVAARVPLLEAARAHEMLESGGVAGKVVLVAE